MPAPIIYTIGHSTHSQTHFLDLLQCFEVTALVDVRSIPASSFNPQYNQSSLSAFLKQHGISYLHFGQSFGARQSSPECLNNQGQVDFEKVRMSAHFKNGIERLKVGLGKGQVIALMCAESEPCQCHRFGMISPALINNNMEVRHILKDKTWIPNFVVEQQILQKYTRKILDTPMFLPLSPEERLQYAYTQLNKEIGYVNKT